MAKLEILAGTTSKTVKVFIQDNSVTTGAGLTGLAFNTAGLTAYYIREGAAAAVAISLATATLGTWATGGFVVVDGTNMPGVYELSLPNAALAAGAKSVLVYLQGATKMAPIPLEIELTAVDNQNAVSYGLTDLDAAISSRMATYAQPTGFLAATFPTGTVANQTNITGGTITNLTNAPTAGDFTATMKTSLNAATPASVGAIGAGGISSTSFATGAITTASFAAGAITAAVTDSTFNNAIASSTLTNAMTEAYPTKGATFSLSKGIYALHQFLTEFNIATTTYSVLKRDQSTTASTLTLNSATTPTAITQAT